MLRNLVKIVFNIILFQSQKIETLFKLGNYSHLPIPALNTNECGFGAQTFVYELSFDAKCFTNRYKDKTVYFIEKPRSKLTGTHQRIYKGEDTKLGEAPFAVFLKPRKWLGWHKTFCTGVLITLEWVLTSAHCFQEWADSIGSGIEVFGGRVYGRGLPNQYREMNKYFSHPIYIDPYFNLTTTLNKTQMDIRKSIHDIALIKLKSKFIRYLTKDNKYYVNTICLPEEEDTEEITKTDSPIFIYYGYGRVGNDSLPLPTILQKGHIGILYPHKCEANSFCGRFFPNGPRLCAGDSGGPLIQFLDKRKQRVLLIGITRSITTVTGVKSCDDNV